MPSDMRSISFIFHREDAANSQNTSRGQKSRLRRRLQDKFDKEDVSACSNKGDRSWQNISQDSRRVLRNGAVRITRTWSNVKLSLDTFSQKFKTSTKRCQILEEQFTPKNCNLQTPQTRSRDLLGRTPTKLYSPFGIESPPNWDHELDKTPAQAVPKLCQNKTQRFFKLFKEKSFYGLRSF